MNLNEIKMTKTTLEEKIRDIYGEWIPQAMMDDLLDLFASELKVEKKRWIEKVKSNLATSGNGNFYLDGRNITMEEYEILNELNEKLTKLEEEK